jgi:hypothetical protein
MLASVDGIASALFGLVGVVVGGAMTAATAWWQTITAQRAKRSELEINFQNERVLRDEAAKRTALLETYYLLRIFEHETYVLYSEHRHGTGDSPMMDICGRVDISSSARCFKQYRDSVDRHSAIFGKALNGNLERIIDHWDTAILDGEPLGHRDYDHDYGYKYPVYCDTGYDFLVLHQDIEAAVELVVKEIEQISAI